MAVEWFVVEEGPVFFTSFRMPRGLQNVPLDRPILAVSINDLFDAHGRIRAERANSAAARLTSFYADTSTADFDG